MELAEVPKVYTNLIVPGFASIYDHEILSE